MAPRGGRFSTQIVQTFGSQAFDTFDTLNPYVFRGNGAAGINLTFDSLMVRALDEPDALYGLVAGGPSLFGAVAPLGGALMIGGWAYLALVLFRGGVTPPP